jgi:hypothetical protein
MAATNVNTEAKEAFISKIINLFPNDYICEDNKKYYFWSNGVQVCVALTCPKNPVGGSSTPPSAFTAETETKPPVSVEYTEEEIATINKLMSALGI